MLDKMLSVLEKYQKPLQTFSCNTWRLPIRYLEQRMRGMLTVGRYARSQQHTLITWNPVLAESLAASRATRAPITACCRSACLRASSICSDSRLRSSAACARAAKLTTGLMINLQACQPVICHLGVVFRQSGTQGQASLARRR